MSMTNKSFFILSIEDEYIQCAGARAKLTVEYKLDKIYRVGLDKADKSPVSINYSGGIIQLYANETLSINLAKEIFHSFFENKIIPDNYILRELDKDYR